MFTYQINVEYLGTNFVGWQIQKNGTSVQGVLEKVLSNFLKYKIKVIGSGRTDSGVHANEQSAHFKTKDKIKDKNVFINSINFFFKEIYYFSPQYKKKFHTLKHIRKLIAQIKKKTCS